MVFETGFQATGSKDQVLSPCFDPGIKNTDSLGVTIQGGAETGMGTVPASHFLH